MRLIHSMEVRDEAQVGAARRAVHEFAGEVGFAERELAEIDIVVQELGTNAARYAMGGGCVHFTRPPGDEPGVEIFYWDQGPGIDDLDGAVRDGVSTGGSLGAGIGAMRRLMDEFDVYSAVRQQTARLAPLSVARRRTTHGTAILCRKWVVAAGTDAPPPSPPLPMPERAAAMRRSGAWSRPMPGEDTNGDAYFVGHCGAQTLLAVVDGLGHGRGAHEAARAALGVLGDWQGEPLEDLFRDAHEALRPTRGAVMGAAVIDAERETLAYAGVGNIEVRSSTRPNRRAQFQTTARSAPASTASGSGPTSGRKARPFFYRATGSAIRGRWPLTPACCIAARNCSPAS